MPASEALVGAPRLACPRDARAMRPLDTGAARCERCGGTWIDAEALRTLAAEPERGDEEAGFACPGCGGACVEAWLAGLRVDACAEGHGAWIERGELAEARRRPGGDRTLTALLRRL